MATPGTIISGIGHVGLIAWLIAGWGFQAEPLPIETMDVSIISGEEFEQMRASATPDPGDADPQAPVPPQISDETPTAPVAEDAVPLAPPPEPVTPPDVDAPLPPAPPQIVPDAPVVEAPALPPAPPIAPQPAPNLDVSDAPTPPQAPVVSSEISQPPPDDAQIDDVVRESVVPDETATAQAVVEEQDATAPEQTTTQIVIDDLAPTTSVRPSTRPVRPQTAAVETPTPDPVEDAPTQQEDVAAALEAALAASEAPAIAAGPPMTGAERDSFRVAVNRCWNVDPGSVAARVTVEVGFNLERDGSVRGNEVRLISSQGDTGAVDIAFQAARRAVLRCQSGGYQLPADKYDQWQEVVITFDPSGMRLR